MPTETGDWGRYFEQVAGAWTHPRAAFVTGLPESDEQQGRVHLHVYPNPEKDGRSRLPFDRHNVHVWERVPKPTEAGPLTGDGKYGVFVPDVMPGQPPAKGRKR